MRRGLKHGLMMAALAWPALAGAQDDHRHGDWHGGGDRGGGRPAPAPGAPPPPQQPPRAPDARGPGQFGRPQPGQGQPNQFQPGRPQPGQFQPGQGQPGQFQPGRRYGGAGGYAGRGPDRFGFDRGAPPVAGGAGGVPGGSSDGGYRARVGRFGAGGPPVAPGSGGYRPQPGQFGYRPQPGQPGYEAPGQYGYRPQPGQPGYQPRPGQPGYRPGGYAGGYGGGYGGRPQPGYRPAPPGPNGGWSRGWRDDRRYDVRSYRIQNSFVFHLDAYRAPRGWGYGYRRFAPGYTLTSFLFGPDYYLSDPYLYRLPPVEWPYQWVRYYDDALLVDTRTGVVVDAVYGIFW